MKRFLAPLTVALLFALVVISVVGSVAFGQIVGLRVQAESMMWPSGSDIIVRDDGTTDDGSHIRYTGNADQADRADTRITPSQQVNQIQLRVRESGGGLGEDRLAVYVDSTQVGTVLPPAGSRWETHVLNLSSPISQAKQRRDVNQ
jgi:hypothetical protein